MGQKLPADDTRQIALVRKLLHDRRGGAPHSKLEVNGVSEIDGKGYAVDNHEKPLAQLLIGLVLFPMQRKEHHDDIKHICVENGGSIKQQTSLEHVKGIGEIGCILQTILQTRYLIDQEYQQQVPQNRQQGGIYLVMPLFHRSFKSLVAACRIACAFLMRPEVPLPSVFTTLLLIKS